jgi:enediyne biosynthesis protein E4
VCVLALRGVIPVLLFCCLVACTGPGAASFLIDPGAGGDAGQDSSVDLPDGPPAGLRLGDEVVCDEPEPLGPLLSFEDRAEEMGITFVPATPEAEQEDVSDGANSLDVELVGGLVVADLNGDEHLDLLFTDSRGPLRLFVGDGALGFESTCSSEVGLPTGDHWLHGASAVDLEGDGDLDLYLLNREHNIFLRNDGGTFVDITAELGLAGGAMRSLSASWMDFDRDGDLDTFVSNHSAGAEPGGFAGSDRDAFFVRGDDGVFVDRIDDLFPESLDGYGFLGGWLDADEDGLQDLLVVNDLATEHNMAPNVFAHSLGPDAGGGWAWEVLPESGLMLPMLAMGLALGDMDNDMDLDVHVANAGPPLLVRNDGDLLFTDISLVVRDLAFSDDADISFSTNWFDHDNDGWQELHTTFAHMPSKGVGYGPDNTNNAEEQPDALWLWDPVEERYQDIAVELGVDDPAMNHSTVVADLDRDGFQEIVLWGLYSGPKLLVPGCNTNSWLEVHLEAPGSGNHFAIGARVEVWADGEPWQMRQVQAGISGNFSGGPPEVHFGTGDHAAVDVVVRWPDGSVTVNERVPTRRQVWLSL